VSGALRATEPAIDPFLLRGDYRLRIMGMLAGGRWVQVSTLRKKLNADRAQISRDLKLLQEARYVGTRKQISRRAKTLAAKLTEHGAVKLAAHTAALCETLRNVGALQDFAPPGESPNFVVPPPRFASTDDPASPGDEPTRVYPKPTRAELSRLPEVLGRNIFALRDARDWSLVNLAAATVSGNSPRAFRSYEQGWREPPFEVFVDMCIALGARPGAVLDAVCDEVFAVAGTDSEGDNDRRRTGR
jgi:winged helix DNA-binding protein